MTSINNSTVQEIFKRVYKDEVIQAIPMDDFLISRDIKFTASNGVGEELHQAVVLGAEVGITFAGSATDINTINPSIAGATRQAVVKSYVSQLRSSVALAAISRSQSTDVAFFEATKHVMKNNIDSHRRFLEIVKIHGQNTSKLLGRVSYATATYRGVAFTAGAATLNGLVFATGGVCAASKAILLQPGDFASGIWVGMQGVKVKELLASDLSVVAEGKLVSVQSNYGYITVDFTPVVASSTGSHILCFEGMELSNEMPGILQQLNNTGTNFGISAATYPLWRANKVTLAQTLLTYARLSDAISDAVNAGGLSGKLKAYVNPRTADKLVSVDLAAHRVYDSSYKDGKLVQGAEGIIFKLGDVELEIVGHRYIMEGDCLVLRLSDWVNSGVQDVRFGVKGLADDRMVQFPLDQSAMVATSYSDQYIFCSAPAKQLLITGINDESAS